MPNLERSSSTFAPMLSRKVLVQNITNLTDARYFAAWCVDYLSYNQNQDSDYFIPYENVLEIKEWVEGPKTLIESNAIEYLEEIDGQILRDAYSSLPLTKEAFFRTSLTEVKKGFPAGNYIIKIKANDLKELNSIPDDKLFGINLYLDVTELDFSSIKELPDHGLVIQGGEEEKVGLRSFEDIQDLMEELEIED